MNNFQIVIEHYFNVDEAEEGVNETIEELSEDGSRILDITSHVTYAEGELLYTFIFKVEEE